MFPPSEVLNESGINLHTKGTHLSNRKDTLHSRVNNSFMEVTIDSRVRCKGLGPQDPKVSRVLVSPSLSTPPQDDSTNTEHSFPTPKDTVVSGIKGRRK